MQPGVRAVLTTADIFDSFTDSQLTLVAALCTPVTYQKGHILLEENESSDDLYVIGRGGVEVLINAGPAGTEATQQNTQPIALAELRQGQVFGEVALVDQGVRSATIRISRDDTLLLRIRRDQLIRLCETYPILGYKLMRNLAAELAGKIRQTDWLVRQYQLRLMDENPAASADERASASG